jgi:hypothetical protein
LKDAEGSVTQGERDPASSAWDAEYVRGRYRGEPPLPFVDDILKAAKERGLAQGVYVGCGNGRNYVPLVRGGLDLIGLDISRVAIEQLAAQMPERSERLIVGDLAALSSGFTCPLIVAIQVFQHGRREEAIAHIRAAQGRVALGGLLCIRVNAASTEVFYGHSVTEQEVDGSFTAKYLAGPKRGLHVRFFAKPSLTGLFVDRFKPILPPRLAVTTRRPPERGTWSQWEAIWQRMELSSHP